MEKIESDMETKERKILEDIYKIRTENVSDSKQIGLVRIVVTRTIDKIKETQKSIEANRVKLDEDLQEVEVEDESPFTEEDQNTLREVLEKQTDDLFLRLNNISINLEEEIKTIKDLTKTPTKFTEDP